MATGATKMSNFNYFQNGKYGSIPQNTQKDMEVSQDMHLKMSKKIAQLTKVIYALNTKNDEHEAVVQTIKEQHEERIQQLYSETRTKIEYYKDKIGDEAAHVEKIEALQGRIKEHEHERDKVLNDFESFKENTAMRESDLKTQHAKKMLELSQEVLSAKKDFESRLSLLETLKEQLANDKTSALSDLQEKHKLELESLRNSLNSEKDNVNAANEELESKYRSDLERLQSDIGRLSSEKKQLVEDHEAKMSKSQAFFEKELEALKNSQNSSHEEQFAALQAQYDELSRNTKFAENQHQKRVDDLLHQLALREEEIENVKQQLNSLQQHIHNKDSNSALMNEQLEIAKSDAASAIQKLKETEMQLLAMKERCDRQASELVHKSTSIGELEATKLQHESTIQDLRTQLEKMDDRLKWLEGSKKALESKTQVLSEEQSGQLKSLQKSLEDMSIEKQKLREQLEREIKSLKESAQLEKEKLKASHASTVEVMSKEQLSRLEDLKVEADKTLAQVKNELEVLLEDERTQHRNDELASQDKYEKLKTELMFKLSQAEEEVQRLTRIVEQSEQGLGSATSQMNSLHDTNNRLKAELDQTRTELRSTKAKHATVMSDYDKLKVLHDSKMKEAELELKNKLEHLAIDLDSRWKETLRKECAKLRAEITEQKEEDKRAALAQLTKLKEDQFTAAKQAWENKVQELLAEISQLRSQLDSHQLVSSEELDELRKTSEAENKRLTQDMLQAAEDFTHKIDALETTYKEQLEQLQTQKDREKQELEGRLRGSHMEELQAMTLAHKSQISTIKDDADSNLQEQLDKLRLKHGQKLESLRTELEHQHSIDMEQMTREHQQQLFGAKMELERAMEITRQKEAEHAMKCSELEERIHHRETSIRSLEEEISKLRQGVSDMAKELDAKGKEILKIRSEANNAARAREEEFLMSHQQELEALHADHAQETQQLLAEFGKAQELLKGKISELQILLEEAEDRYHNREPRPEDLALIQQLQDAVLERQEAMKKLLDDKKFYQMELVNRETNFNKLFTASPNVGVLNPLVKKPKKIDPAPMKFSSAPSLNNRLDPLPGSPHHDSSFNSMRPLPPPTKKFVR